MSDPYASLWNFNPDEAPKSYFVTETRKLRGEPVSVQVQKDVFIFAAFLSKDGPKMTRSRWLIREERWECFSKNEVFYAWLPYPTPPEPRA